VIKQLVLLGAGDTHVEFLRRWARKPMAGVQVTLIARREPLLDFTLLPYWVEGLVDEAELAIDMEAITHRAHAAWPNAQAHEVDAAASTIRLQDGRALRYDWLSMDREPVQMRALADIAMPGARKNGLFVRPMAAFCTLWPKVVALAQSQSLRVAVIADPHSDLTSLALAFAVRQRLPGAAITLVTGGETLANGQPAPMRKRLALLLRQRNITVLADHATCIEVGEVGLGSGARLACDVPLMVTRAQAPTWGPQGGLQVDAEGFAITDAHGRSVNHPNVFVPSRGTRHTAATLMAMVLGKSPPSLRPKSITMLGTARGQALVSWGELCLHGRAAGWLKWRLDAQPAGNIRKPG
jgi:NADH dehydrogenase FAD-containing subunit